MATRKRPVGGDPRRHTAIIGDVETMWQKLVWDIHQFDQIQRSNPDLKEPLGLPRSMSASPPRASLTGLLPA